MNIRDEILAIMVEVRDDIDFSKEEKLISSEILDSFDIISIMALISDRLNIELDPSEIDENTFDSLDKIVNFVTSSCKAANWERK